MAKIHWLYDDGTVSIPQNVQNVTFFLLNATRILVYFLTNHECKLNNFVNYCSTGIACCLLLQKMATISICFFTANLYESNPQPWQRTNPRESSPVANGIGSVNVVVFF